MCKILRENSEPLLRKWLAILGVTFCRTLAPWCLILLTCWIHCY